MEDLYKRMEELALATRKYGDEQLDPDMAGYYHARALGIWHAMSLIPNFYMEGHER